MAEKIPTKGVVYLDATGRRVIPFLVVNNVVRFSPALTQAPDFAQGQEFQTDWATFLGSYERLLEASPAITSDADISLEEGTALDFDLTADETVTFTITGGDDAASFVIASNTLDFAGATAPAFASPEDADEDNVYELIVTATDAQGLTTSLAMTVTVTETPAP